MSGAGDGRRSSTLAFPIGSAVAAAAILFAIQTRKRVCRYLFPPLSSFGDQMVSSQHTTAVSSAPAIAVVAA